MIRHIVVFRTTGDDPKARKSAGESLKAELAGLRGNVPGLLSLELGSDVGGIATHWDVSLMTEHESLEDLAAYQGHPEHRRVVALIDAFVSDRAVVDYVVED